MKSIRFWTPQDNLLERQQIEQAYGTRSINKVWSAHKIAILVKLYPNMTNQEIGDRLGLSADQVQSKAVSLKLLKTKEFKLEWSRKTCFKKGHVPANKGKDCRHYHSDKSRATQFKKGQMPHNTMHDGAISIRADKRGVERRFIRVALGRWIYYAIYVWEQAHGPVPKGMCIRHKSDDWLDDSLDNLEMITQKENRLRNSGSINLSDGYVAATIYTKKHPELKNSVLASPELIEIKRLQIQLKRTINEKSNDNDSSAKPGQQA